MNKGFTKLYRKIFDDEYFKKNHDAFYLFNYLISRCNYEPNECYGISLKRGQCIVSVRGLPSEINIDYERVRRILKKLERDKMIKVVGKQSNYTIITVLNYSKYQDKNNALNNAQTNAQNNAQTNALNTSNNRGHSKNATHKTTHKTTHDTTHKTPLEKNNKEVKEVKENIYSQIQNLYNNTCKTLPKCSTLSDQRKRMIDARLKDYTIDDFKKVFELANKSDFISGRSGKWTNCNFDWLIKPNNFLKVIEGTYTNKKKSNKIESHDYDFNELERKLNKANK